LKQLSKEKKLETVVMRVEKKILKHFGDQLFYNGFVSQKDLKDTVEMTFLSPSLEGFARWYMMFGDYADIISPESLKDIIRKITVAISEKI
jgi:predicted DNA-binding transcriptional regulator YafY